MLGGKLGIARPHDARVRLADVPDAALDGDRVQVVPRRVPGDHPAHVVLREILVAVPQNEAAQDRPGEHERPEDDAQDHEDAGMPADLSDEITHRFILRRPRGL
jgi:hypothetical protein